jgi:hypothetical protein
MAESYQKIGTSTLLRTWGNNPPVDNVIEPPSTLFETGWTGGQEPPAEWMNYVDQQLGEKINHVLQNGGSKWNNTTAYLVGNVVQHSNAVWLCLVNNTNSTPTDVNVNWSKVLTLSTLPAYPTLNSLLPSQTGNSGRVLTTDGSNASWGANTGAYAYVLYDNTINANITGTATRTGGVVNCNVVGHGHKVNHWAYFIFTGTITSSAWYKVTAVTDANNFSIALAGADVVTPASLTLRRRPIMISSNVANVPTANTNDSGNFQVVNLINPTPNVNSVKMGESEELTAWGNEKLMITSSNDNTFSDISFRVFALNASSGGDLGYSRGNIVVFA